MYDGGIVRELRGEAINEENIVSSALNVSLEHPAPLEELPA
jgi:hypothetical protein